MRRPPRQGDQLKGRGDAPIGEGITLLIERHGAGDHGAPERGSALSKGGGLAHGAEVLQQPERITVTDRGHLPVRRREGKARALEKARRLSDLREGRDAQGRASGEIGFSLQNHSPQFPKRLRAEQRRHEKAVGAQGQTQLHQSAGKVVDPAQGQGREDQIKGLRRKRRVLGIEGHVRALLHHIGDDGEGGLAQGGPEDRAGAQSQHLQERPIDRFKPLKQVLGGAGLQKGGVGKARACGGAALALTVSAGVEWAFHDGGHLGRGAMKHNALTRLFRGAADLIWPPRSLLSDRPVDHPGRLEATEFSQLPFLAEPLCFRCGFPLPAYVGPEGVCGACAAVPPDYDRARAALAYGEAARTLVLQMKRAGRRDGLPAFGGWMAQAGAPLIADSDVIVPVPLHWRRLATRTFNQAAWLAQAVQRRCGLPLAYDAMVRRKAGGQASLTANERKRQVQGAFRVRRKGWAQGRRVLLVDDVMTTGATVEACARALKRDGAAGVHVLALARVVEPVDVSI